MPSMPRSISRMIEAGIVGLFRMTARSSMLIRNDSSRSQRHLNPKSQRTAQLTSIRPRPASRVQNRSLGLVPRSRTMPHQEPRNRAKHGGDDDRKEPDGARGAGQVCRPRNTEDGPNPQADDERDDQEKDQMPRAEIPDHSDSFAAGIRDGEGLEQIATPRRPINVEPAAESAANPSSAPADYRRAIKPA